MYVSRSTVARILRALGYVWKMPKLRAPGSIRKDYRKRREVANYRRIAPALREKGILVLCEDEKWIELNPRVEGKWIEKGMEEFVATPGYTARWNCFISLYCSHIFSHMSLKYAMSGFIAILAFFPSPFPCMPSNRRSHRYILAES